MMIKEKSFKEIHNIIEKIFNMKVNIKKLDENAVIPKYQTEGAACLI